MDSDTVIASIQMVDDVMCCDCDDLCNDVNICSCLKLQRNYTNNGTLIAAKGRTIVECNLRCSCSVRRCTNRVVGKGLKYPLKVVQMHRRQISVARSEMQLCGDCSTVASTLSNVSYFSSSYNHARLAPRPYISHFALNNLYRRFKLLRLGPSLLFLLLLCAFAARKISQLGHSSAS